MPWDMLLQLAEVRCATASSDVRAKPNLLFWGVSYNNVAQKWRILAIFHKQNNFWEITCKVLGFKTMFKS